MSNQSRGIFSPFNQQRHSLRDNRTKNGHKKRCLSFHLPPKNYRVSIDDDSNSGGSSSADNNIQAYHHHGGHLDNILSWNNDGFKVSFYTTKTYFSNHICENMFHYKDNNINNFHYH